MKLNNHSYLNMRTQFPYPQTALWYVSQKKKKVSTESKKITIELITLWVAAIPLRDTWANSLPTNTVMPRVWES